MNPADCEVRSVIRFSKARKVGLADLAPSDFHFFSRTKAILETRGSVWFIKTYFIINNRELSIPFYFPKYFDLLSRRILLLKKNDLLKLYIISTLE